MKRSPKGTPYASPVKVTSADGQVTIHPAEPAHYRPNRKVIRPHKVPGRKNVPGSS